MLQYFDVKDAFSSILKENAPPSTKFSLNGHDDQIL